MDAPNYRDSIRHGANARVERGDRATIERVTVEGTVTVCSVMIFNGLMLLLGPFAALTIVVCQCVFALA